jgi:RNA polymerase sigma-70 factor (ECF subfamily)
MVGGNERDTRKLLRNLLKGDELAWQAFIGDYAGLMLGIARRTFATYGFDSATQDAEDAVAEAWRNLLDRNGLLIRKCLKRGNLLQTLIVLARNRAVDIMRKRKGITVEFEERHGGSVDFPAPEAPQPSDSALRTAVRKLPDRERTLVTLFFLQRRKYREIAVLTGIPQNSIGPTIARALRRLREDIGPEDTP